LAEDSLIDITEAFALIRLNRFLCANNCRIVSYQGFVNASDNNFISGNFCLDSFRIFHLNSMRESQMKDQLFTIFLRSISYPTELEFFLKPCGNARDHVVN